MRLLQSVKSYLSYLRYPLKSFSDKEPFKDYKIELKNEYFSVYQPKTEKIIAADGNVVCTQLVYRKDILNLCFCFHIFRKQITELLNGD